MTKDRKPEERILDSLSTILSSRSECVSTIIFNGKLQITSNEISSLTVQRSLKFQSITEILWYFQKLAYGLIPTPEYRNKIFTKISDVSQFKKTVNKKIAGELINSILQGEPNSIKRLSRAYGKELKEASFMNSVFARLYLCFSKVEEALNTYKISHVNTNLLTAIQNICLRKKKFRNKYFYTTKCIVRSHSEDDIHAEMKQLANLIQRIDQTTPRLEIYVGLSKLCCMACRCMLEAANDIFEENRINVKLSWRGHHDLLFEDKWAYPEEFISDPNSIGFKIYERAQAAINELLKEPKPKVFTPMEPSESESEAEIKKLPKVKKQLKKLREKLDFLNLADSFGRPIKYFQDLFTKGIELHSLNSISHFYGRDPINGSKVKEIIANLQIEYYINYKKKISKDAIEEVICFPDMVCKPISNDIADPNINNLMSHQNMRMNDPPTSRAFFPPINRASRN